MVEGLLNMVEGLENMFEGRNKLPFEHRTNQQHANNQHITKYNDV